MEVSDLEVQFFKTIGELRRWFRTKGKSQTEIYIGFYRKGTGNVAVTYPEALDEALCWGWIDGVRKKLDDESYTNRFSPRKPNSIWSLVNIEHVNRLTKDGRMQPSGIAAFEARKAHKTGIYSFEQDKVEFDAAMLQVFQANSVAWEFWEKQPPGYRKVATHWVTIAKKVETKDRRLQILIGDSERGERLAVVTGKKKDG